MQRLFVLFILSLSVIPSSFATSFNCSKATSLQNKLICATPALSAADTQLSVVYKNALSTVSDPAALKKAQEDWLTHRDICTDANCLLKSYQTRIADLQQEITAALPITPRNPDGTYPVWVSPDLGLKSLSRQDIDAALERKFWDVPAYQGDFKKEVDYLKAHQNDETLYQAQMHYYRNRGNPHAHQNSELGTAPTKENAIPITCNQLLEREYGGGLWTFDLSISDASKLTYTLFLARLHSDCQAINLLHYVRPADQSFVHDFIFTKNFTDFLPALITPDDFSCSDPEKKAGDNEIKDPQALPQNQQKSWREFYGFNSNLKNSDDFQIRSLTLTDIKLYLINSSSSHTYIRLLAKGDFDESGIEKILMAVDIDREDAPGDAGRQGSNLFLLTRYNPMSILTVVYPGKYIERSCDIQLDDFAKELSSHLK